MIVFVTLEQEWLCFVCILLKRLVMGHSLLLPLDNVNYQSELFVVDRYIMYFVVKNLGFSYRSRDAI